MMDAGEGIYKMAKAFEEGTTIEWKYVLNGTTWEELGEDVCTTGGGYINRTITVTDDDMMFDPVPCFGSCYEWRCSFNSFCNISSGYERIAIARLGC